MIYCIVQADSRGQKAPSIGCLFKRDSLEDAINLAVELTLEQSDILEKTIREEIEGYLAFYDTNGEFSISVVVVG